MAKRVAIVCSAHGYGHFARQCATADELASRGCDVTVFANVPAEVAAAGFASRPPRFVRWACDVGLVQRDSLGEDLEATAVAARASLEPARLDALAEALVGFDHALVDCAPQALEAARLAGVPTTAVGNFDWATTYAHYPPLREIAARFAELQAPHAALELTPGIGMRGFASRREVGLLARHAAPRRVVAAGEHQALACFSSGLDDVGALLPRIPGVRWVLAPPLAPLDRDDCVFAPDVAPDVPFRSLVAGASFVLTKPGYGIFGECAVHGVAVAYFDRGDFPEAPAIEAALRARGDVRVEARSRAAVERAVRGLLERLGPVAADEPRRAEAVSTCSEAARAIADAITARPAKTAAAPSDPAS